MKHLLVLMLIVAIAGFGTLNAEAKSKPQKEYKKEAKQKVERKIYINFARLDELKSLPGIDDEIAQAILAARPYETVEELLNIEGIDDALLSSLEKFIEVRMNVNGTSARELEKLPWVTSDMARAIVDDGPYPIIEGSPYTGLGALVLIDGMNESILKELEDFLEIRMDINNRDVLSKDLQTLPGVTPEIADSIVKTRDACKECSYKAVEDLLDVDGIDESLFADIKRLIFVRDRRGMKLPGQGR